MGPKEQAAREAAREAGLSPEQVDELLSGGEISASSIAAMKAGQPAPATHQSFVTPNFGGVPTGYQQGWSTDELLRMDPAEALEIVGRGGMATPATDFFRRPTGRWPKPPITKKDEK